MAKSKNYKGNPFTRQGNIKLRSILNEVKSQTNKRVNEIKKLAVLDEIALNGILNSGVLTIEESTALRGYFSAKKITRINESNIHRIDEGISLLTEDWFATVKDFMGKQKDKAVAAIKSGWNGVKTIWANFKDMVVELANTLKEALTKAFQFILKGIQAGATKIKEKINEVWYEEFSTKHKHEHSDLVKELQQLLETGKFTLKYAQGIVKGEKWEKELIAGNITPKGDAEGDESEPEIKKDVEAIAQESVNAYTNIFNNRKILSTLIRPGIIKESGHLEDALKDHPTLKAVIHWGMLGIKAIFAPGTLLMTAAAKFIAKNIFSACSQACKAIGGPGVFKFAIMSLMAVEIYEIFHTAPEVGDIEEFTEHKVATIAKYTGMALEHIPGIDILVQVFKIMGFLIIAYALGTVLYNIFMAFKALKGGGGEEAGGAEPENAGYKPRGNFKLSEGKLIFVK